MVWDTTPEALHAWREGRTVAYADAANASLDNPLGASLCGVLSDLLENAASKVEIPESETLSMSLHLDARIDKKVSGKGPYPVLVEALAEVLGKRNGRPLGLWPALRAKVALTLWGLLCFARVHGVVGLERWIARKFSASHALKRAAVRRRARRLYRDGRRRARVFRGSGHRDGVGGQGRGRRCAALQNTPPAGQAREPGEILVGGGISRAGAGVGPRCTRRRRGMKKWRRSVGQFHCITATYAISGNLDCSRTARSLRWTPGSGWASCPLTGPVPRCRPGCSRRPGRDRRCRRRRCRHSPSHRPTEPARKRAPSHVRCRPAPPRPDRGVHRAGIRDLPHTAAGAYSGQVVSDWFGP